MKIDPLQLFEKVLTPTNQFTNYWQTILRNLFQNIKDSQTIVSNTDYQYTFFGNTLTLNYQGTSGTVIYLPFKIAENQIINYWEDGVIKMIDISKNDMKITIPNGNIKLTCTIMVRQ